MDRHLGPQLLSRENQGLPGLCVQFTLTFYAENMSISFMIHHSKFSVRWGLLPGRTTASFQTHSGECMRALLLTDQPKALSKAFSRVNWLLCLQAEHLCLTSLRVPCTPDSDNVDACSFPANRHGIFESSLDL